jgi:carbon storage regulator
MEVPATGSMEGRPMLVLTRRKNQSIVIGGDIVVTVLEVKGDQIRLGITAPRNVQVYREELLAPRSDASTLPVDSEGAPSPAPPATSDSTSAAVTPPRVA